MAKADKQQGATLILKCTKGITVFEVYSGNDTYTHRHTELEEERN